MKDDGTAIVLPEWAKRQLNSGFRRLGAPSPFTRTMGLCWFCCGMIYLRKDGTIRSHRTTAGLSFVRDIVCEGTGTLPADRMGGDPRPARGAR